MQLVTLHFHPFRVGDDHFATPASYFHASHGNPEYPDSLGCSDFSISVVKEHFGNVTCPINPLTSP